MVELLKKVLNIIAMPVRLIVGVTADLVKVFSKLFMKCASYTYDACDLCVKHIIMAFRNQHMRMQLWFGRENKGRYFKLTLMPLTVVVAAIVVTYAFSFYFFVVPPGDSAVITRFGKYNRVLSSGLGFRFPLVERYYIVANETIREERFGFRQGDSKGAELPYIKDAQGKYIRDVYEPKIIQSEEDSGEFFSAKGDLLDELSRKQRMSHDYVKRKFAPEVPKTPEMIKQKIGMKEELRRKQESIGSRLSGQFPYHSERQMLTGDMSIVYIEWTLQYYINDVEAYLFNSRDVQQNIRDISLAIMNEVIGEYRIDGIITYERHNIEKEVISRIQKLIDEYNIGIKVTQVIILNALPPKEVEPAFNEVNKAAQDMERLKHNAEIEYLKVIPKAKGEAERIVLEAEGYAVETINKAKGEAGQFLKINREYIKAKQITEDRLYIEAMEKIIKETPNIIMDNKVKGVLPVFMGGDNASQLKEMLKGKDLSSLESKGMNQSSVGGQEIKHNSNPDLTVPDNPELPVKANPAKNFEPASQQRNSAVVPAHGAQSSQGGAP